MRCANSSATEGNLSLLYGEYLHVAKTWKRRQWAEPVCSQTQKVSLPDARCIFMSKDVQTPLYFLPDSYRLPNWVWWQGVFIIVMHPPDSRRWIESCPSKWVTNHLINQMYPSKQVHSKAWCFTVLWLNACAGQAFFATSTLLSIHTAHTPQLHIYFLTRCLYWRTLGPSVPPLTRAQRCPVPMLLMLTEAGHIFPPCATDLSDRMYKMFSGCQGYLVA